VNVLRAFAAERDQGFERLQQTVTDFADGVLRSTTTLADEWANWGSQLDDASRQLFMDGVAHQLRGQLDGLTDSLSDLAAAGERLGQVFGEDARGVVEKVREVAELIERIKPLLDLVDQIA
jgi:hypothetical protein